MVYYLVERWASLYTKTFIGIMEASDEITNSNLLYSAAKTELNISPEEILYFSKIEFDPGSYLPRIARPQLSIMISVSRPSKGPLYVLAENMVTMPPHDKSCLANSVNQLTILVSNLRDVMKYIQPDHSNLECYGHHTRHILLLASMEFENECKGVLRAHNYGAASDRFDTKDYIKIMKPMRLDDYAVSLSHFPQIDQIAPFVGWNHSSPTKAYPGTMHTMHQSMIENKTFLVQHYQVLLKLYAQLQ